MQVVATDKGFNGITLIEEGDRFTIPDQPSRKVTKSDDEVTRAAAKDGNVPLAFTSAWMIPASMAKKATGRKAPVPEMTNIDQVIEIGGVPQREEAEEEPLTQDVI